MNDIDGDSQIFGDDRHVLMVKKESKEGTSAQSGKVEDERARERREDEP